MSNAAIISSSTHPARVVFDVRVVDELNIAETHCNASVLRVYPNPTNTQLTISLPNPSEGGAYTAESIEIYNIVGQNVGAYPCGRPEGGKTAPSLVERAGGEVIIDVSHLPAGLYFLKIDGKTVKFVKE